MDRRQQIDQFFDRYARIFNQALIGSADVEATAESFASCFIEAGPAGVSCGKNDEQFRSVIPQGYAYYQSIGINTMEIISQDTVLLDAFHAISTIHWRSAFTRKDGKTGNLEFGVIYLLQIINNEPKIFAYITGNEELALREQGLIE